MFTTVTVDSLDLGIYIFQEKNFRSWIDFFPEGKEVNIYALSSSERYVASLLLFNDQFHFKRRPTKLKIENDAKRDLMNQQEDLHSISTYFSKILQDQFCEEINFAKYLGRLQL